MPRGTYILNRLSVLQDYFIFNFSKSQFSANLLQIFRHENIYTQLKRYQNNIYIWLHDAGLNYTGYQSPEIFSFHSTHLQKHFQTKNPRKSAFGLVTVTIFRKGKEFEAKR